MVDNDNVATTGQKLVIKSKRYGNDPSYCRANELLRQIEQLKSERSKLLEQADQYRKKIDSLEAEFHKLVLELEPTEVVTVRHPKVSNPSLTKLQEALASKLADSPSLEEQLRKILGE